MSTWKKIFNLIKLVTGNVDVQNKGDLQTQVDTLSDTVTKCFTNVSNGKSLVANAVTGKGVPTSADDTFATMATNIGKIKTTPKLQSKSAALHTGATSVVMTPDDGYDGLSQATTTITLQEKTAELSTVAQSITPDSGKVLSKVTVPAVGGDAETNHVLDGKIFSSSNGVNRTGVMPNRGAWIVNTTGKEDVTIPEGYHNGGGHVSGKGAYDAGYNEGRSKGFEEGREDGISYAKSCTAGPDDVLSPKTFTSHTGVNIPGMMPDNGSWIGDTTDAGNVPIPRGYHNGNGYVSGQGAYDAGFNAGQQAATISTATFSVSIDSGSDSPVTRTINVKTSLPDVYGKLTSGNFAFLRTSCRQDGTGQQHASDGTWDISSYNSSTGVLTVTHYRNGTQNNNNASATVKCFYIAEQI